MFKKDIALSVFIFCFALLVDFLWKTQAASDLAHVNRGFIFGSLQDLPASLTLVTLCSMGGFLMFVYVLLIILLSRELILLKAGLSFLAGGILGNVIDRALHGGTLDFIPINLPFFPSLVFNPADAFQWIGAFIIIVKIITKDKIIWYPENQRTFSLFNPKDQIRFALKFTIISLCTCVVLGMFALSYLTLTLKSLHIPGQSHIVGFAISYLSITLLFSVISFFAGLLLSQRTAGPLYAFEKYIEEVLDGSEREFKLREGDNFKHLESVAANIKIRLQKKST